MVPVEQVVNINDPTIIWYRIPGFPGYEICRSNYYVRSFKSRKKYPFGTLVKWNKDNTITLTNRNNQRVKLTMEQIEQLLKENKPTSCKTIEVQNTSRNPLCGIDTNAETLVGTIVAKPKVQTSEDRKIVDFSSIPDIDLNKFI